MRALGWWPCAGGIGALVEASASRRSPLSQVHVHHLEGALGRVPDDATAFGRRDARYGVNIIGLGRDAAMMEPDLAWVRATSDALKVHAGRGTYLNFIADEGQDRVRLAYGPEKYARLAALKAVYDPTNLFHINQNILPAP